MSQVEASLLIMRRKSSPLLSYFDVLDACATDGCPICRLSERAVNRYLDGVLYEFVNDPGVRARLRRSYGYCNEHAWRLVGLAGGNALAIAVIHRDLVSVALARLERLTFDHRHPTWRRLLQRIGWRGVPSRALRPPPSLRARQRCPACERRDEAEQIALTAVLDALSAADERMRDALERSAGFCLPHLRRALSLASDERGFEHLRQLSVRKLKELRSSLDAFVQHSEYRFHGLPPGPESDSWRRALAWLSGGRSSR